MKLAKRVPESILGISLLSLLACAPPSQEAAPGAPAAGMPSPVGTVWRWTALTGSESLEVAQPGRYTLELLADGSYAVRADCNTGGGSYTLQGDRLTLGPGPMTMAACGPDSWGDRFGALLGKVSGFSRDGDRLVLTLADAEGTMQFAAMKPIALAGTSWLVRAYNNGKQAVVSVAAGTTLDATFAEDGTLAGSAGCNNYSTSYQLDGQGITIGPVATTRKMCPGEGVMEQESAFLAALATVATWEIRGERLQLRSADGALVLDLVSAVTGTVTYLTRKALPPNAWVTVQLQDVSRADVPARVIGEQRIATSGRQVPFPFEITFDPAEIDPRFSYGLRATITADERLLYTSTQAYPVITRDSPRYGVEIRVEPAAVSGR